MGLDFRGTNYTLGIRNNNPGNIRPSNKYKWEGEVAENKGFVVYENIVLGFRTLVIDIMNKYARGLNTVKKIIDVYAPPSENNTEAYIQSVAAFIGLRPNDAIVINKRTIVKLVEAIAEHENGKAIYSVVVMPDVIYDAIKLIPDTLKAKLQ